MTDCYYSEDCPDWVHRGGHTETASTDDAGEDSGGGSGSSGSGSSSPPGSGAH